MKTNQKAEDQRSCVLDLQMNVTNLGLMISAMLYCCFGPQLKTHEGRQNVRRYGIVTDFVERGSIYL